MTDRIVTITQSMRDSGAYNDEYARVAAMKMLGFEDGRAMIPSGPSHFDVRPEDELAVTVERVGIDIEVEPTEGA